MDGHSTRHWASTPKGSLWSLVVSVQMAFPAFRSSRFLDAAGETTPFWEGFRSGRLLVVVSSFGLTRAVVNVKASTEEHQAIGFLPNRDGQKHLPEGHLPALGF